LRLAEHGTVAVDDPVARFFDRDIVERLGLSGITLLHLMQHTSGLRDMDGDEFMQILYTRPTKQWTAWEKIERSIASGPPDGPPGPPARYCDVGYVVLAMVIEAITGGPLHESFRHLLRFEELGLSAIHVEVLEPVPAAAGPRVSHYVDERDVTDIHPSCDLWGAGGLVSDAHDLAEWWHALFAGLIFDHPATLDRMLTTTPEPSAYRDMGLGIYRRTIDGHEIWAHGGWWGSYPLHDRSTGATAAVLLNQCLDHAGPELHAFAFRLVASILRIGSAQICRSERRVR